MSAHSIQAYVDGAVRFAPRRNLSSGPLRVATTLLTCALAAELLNQMRFEAEAQSAYRHVNVHNPSCPLVFDDRTRRWSSLPTYADHPVWGINWSGARRLCEHLGARLPTAREWESFASNNEPDRRYPWGSEAPTHALANYGEHVGGTSAVGSFPPNELGLYDLAGNVSEWCADAHVSPHGHAVRGERVVKGGAWSKDARYLAIAATRGKWERLGTTTIGLRPVWDD